MFRRRGLLAAFFLGWMLLPVVARFPPGAGPENTPGAALPGAVWWTKAAAIPLVLLIASLLQPGAWRRWRPGLLDVVLALFCALPLLHGRPADAAYLGCVWLATWLLGRVLLATPAARRDALAVAAVTGLALLPIAVLEGVRPPWLYGAIYGPHPYQTTGIERYVGFRPLGFFEDGNQYGIWTAMAALAGYALAREDRRWRPVAIVLALIAVAGQSAGALVLLLIGAAVLRFRPIVPRWLLPTLVVGLLVVGAVVVSRIIPIEHIVRDTRPGQIALGIFRKVGRGSLPWRISQDLRALPLIVQHPLIGHGAWDWWRPLPQNRRPWDLPMLVIGQYGLLGLALLAPPLLAGAVAALRRGARDERFALALVVLLAAVDAALNSAIYFPAVLFAGALATDLNRNAG